MIKSPPQEATPELKKKAKTIRKKLLKEDKFADELDAKEHQGKVPRDGIGRPTVVTVAALSKLEYAFKLGCTDEEACTHAGISVSALHRYFDKHHDFREVTNAWKENCVAVLARANIVEAIKAKNLETSLEYLRTHRKNEWSTRHELTGPQGKPIEVDFNVALRERLKPYDPKPAADGDAPEAGTVIDAAATSAAPAALAAPVAAPVAPPKV